MIISAGLDLRGGFGRGAVSFSCKHWDLERVETLMTIKERLETERLILRPLTEDDFDSVHSWASVPENVRYMSWGPNSVEDTIAFIRGAKPGLEFGVMREADKQLIGSCGIYPCSKETAEAGWTLHRDYWKNGYGTELGHALISYGFDTMGLHRIFALCAADNYGSYRVMENIGMRREGHYLKALWARVDKEWIDQYIYAILAEEYIVKAK